MKRFLVDKIDSVVTLKGQEFAHLSRVLRLHVGDRVILNARDGYDYISEVASITPDSCTLRVLEQITNSADLPMRLTAYCALIKGDHMNYLIQKLTELGVSDFVPITTTRTVVKDKGTKRDRLQAISDQATKQCGRSRAMIVHDVMSLESAVEEFSGYDAVYFANTKESQNLGINVVNIDNPNIAFVIGPEGGFDSHEDALIMGSATSVTLGKRILRADTASIVMATKILIAYGQV